MENVEIIKPGSKVWVVNAKGGIAEESVRVVEIGTEGISYGTERKTGFRPGETYTDVFIDKKAAQARSAEIINELVAVYRKKLNELKEG